MAHHIHRPKKKEMKWRIDKSADAASESCLLLSSEREGKKNQSQYQFAQNPKTGLKKVIKINQMSKVSSSFVGHESIGGNDIRAEGDVSRPYHQSATSHNPANRNLSGGTFGHRSGSDHFHSQEDVNTDTAKTNHLFSAFAPEINLQRMGYSVSDTIDWDRVQLPPKSDLHKQIHFRITNCINPDVLIRIGSSEFRYHMLVLQCYSSFFDEKSVRQIELPESVVSKEAFACIYDWMLHLSQDSYHLLRRDNILSIFSAAQYLGIKELEEQCWAFIDNEDLFNEDTAFLLYLDARKCNNLAVMELMVPRIQRFFLTLVSSKDWLELTVEEVCVFLSSNYISVHCEMEVFMSGVRWLMHDWSNRASHLNDVMRCIRFGLIAPWQLVDIRRNPESPEFIEVTKIPEVQQLVEDGLAFAIIKYWYVQESGDYYHWLDSLKLTEPVPRNWVGSEKNFSSYREFLNDLDLYRRPNSTQKKPDNLPNEKEYSEDESSLSDAASTSVASEPVILRKPVSRKNAPVPSLAEFLASHKDGAEILKLRKKALERRKLKPGNDSEPKPVKETVADSLETATRRLELANKINAASSWTKKDLCQSQRLHRQIYSDVKPTAPSSTAERESRLKHCELNLRTDSVSSIELNSNLELFSRNFKQETVGVDMDKQALGRVSVTPNQELMKKDNIVMKLQAENSEVNSNTLRSHLLLESNLPGSWNNNHNSNHTKIKNPCFDVSRATTLKIQEEYEKRNRAAVRIQAAFRGHIARKFVNLLRLNKKGSLHSQLNGKKNVQMQSSALQENSRQRIYTADPQIYAATSYSVSGNKNPQTLNKNGLIDVSNSGKNNPLTSKGVMMTSQRNYLEEGSLFFENRESVLVFGGIDPHRPYGSERNTGKDVYRYHPEENVWEFVTELPEPRHHHSVAFMKGRIYVVGGADPRESDSSTRAKIVSTVWSFEPVTRAWYTETSMKIARKNFGLVSVNSKLYVIGGQDKYQRILSNVERFDPQTGKWDEMAPLESGRMGVAAAKYRDVIWVCGGMTCAKKSILTSRVDCYDTHRNVWTQGVPLRFPRCFSILFPMNDSLYLIGGAGRQTDRERATSSTSAIDVWDPKKKEWRQECGMAIPRHGHSACYLGLQILILGGVTTSGMCALDKVECWCCQRSAWIRGLANLPSALSGQGSVTLPPAALM